MNNAIEITNLKVSYQHYVALESLNLTVKNGEIFGFLGPNGAGKSTTIKALLGLIFPDSGTLSIRGESPSRVKSRQMIGYLPEETTYYRFLNPVEILSFYGELFQIPKDKLGKRIHELLDLVGLSHVAKRSISTFSKGMAQKIGLAQCLINDPEILILDEPTSGLDPLARLELRKILENLKRQGKTIFFSSHELSEVELICDSVAIIHKGKLLREGSLKEILDTSSEHSLEKFFLKSIQGNS